MDDPTTGVNSLFVIAVILWPLVWMLGCILILNLACNHWHRMRWRWMAHFALWAAINAPRDSDADRWILPPSIPRARHRR